PPPPTATLTQHGQMKIDQPDQVDQSDQPVVGCDVQATRSLFECISVLIPVGMFEGLAGEQQQMRQRRAELVALDELLVNVALAIYDVAPFKIAAIGYERGCQLPIELRSNSD